MFTSILVGTDGSETARTALEGAIELAAGLGARLGIVSAYEPVSDPRLRGEQVVAPEDVAVGGQPARRSAGAARDGHGPTP